MTRCDVFVDTSGVMEGVGTPTRWGAWWAVDGGDMASTLLDLVPAVPEWDTQMGLHRTRQLGQSQLGVDIVAGLNWQVAEVQGAWYHGKDGRPVRFRCHLTGDLGRRCLGCGWSMGDGGFPKKASSRGGDGKGMQAAHPGRGAKCWLCPLDVADTATLGAQATLTSYFIPFT